MKKSIKTLLTISLFSFCTIAEEITWNSLIPNGDVPSDFSQFTEKEMEAMRYGIDFRLNKEVSIEGFAVPLELNSNEVTEFLLVPVAGACIHTPPLPPSQTILVKGKIKMKDFSLSRSYLVKGHIRPDVNNMNANFFDGELEVVTGYVMTDVIVQRR